MRQERDMKENRERSRLKRGYGRKTIEREIKRERERERERPTLVHTIKYKR